jgi:hypothetical protein
MSRPLTNVTLSLTDPFVKRISIIASVVWLCALAHAGAVDVTAAPPWKFNFSADRPLPGTVPVMATSVYSRAAGWGFDLGYGVTNPPPGGVADGHPFFFSVALPEGNYRVTATFGNPSGSTTNTVKAEARRLLLERVVTTNGQFVERRFVVNTRTVNYPGGQVRLKPREQVHETLTWDEKLTLEFTGGRLRRPPMSRPFSWRATRPSATNRWNRGTVGDKCCRAFSTTTWRWPTMPKAASPSGLRSRRIASTRFSASSGPTIISSCSLVTTI